MSYVYILENASSVYYIGYTKDLEKRVADHQQDQGGWTSGRGPWSLRYYEEFEEDASARQREIKLKKAKNKQYLAWLIENGPGCSVG